MEMFIVPMFQLLTRVQFVGFLGISASVFGCSMSFWSCFVGWQVHFGFASFVEHVPLSSTFISDGCFPLFSPRSHHSRIFHSPLYSIFWFVNATKFHRFDCRFLWVFFLYVLLWIIIFFSSLPIVFFPLIFSQAPTRVESSSEPVHVFLPRMDIQCVSARFPFDSFHNRCTWSSP